MAMTSKAQKILEELLTTNTTSSGGVCINDTMIHIVSENLPFGGVGNSGFGKYHGKASFDTFSNTKSVLKNSTFFEIPIRFPPFNKTSLKMIKNLYGLMPYKIFSEYSLKKIISILVLLVGFALLLMEINKFRLVNRCLDTGNRWDYELDMCTDKNK